LDKAGANRKRGAEARTIDGPLTPTLNEISPL
jgi:hypothetical protein